MTQSAQTPLKPREILNTLRKYALLWIVPTMAVTLGALVYGLIKPPVWQARLALHLRDEAVGDVKRHGRFDNLDAMKVAQKTILEIVRSRSVVAAALAEIGPPRSPADHPNWPSAADVDRCRKQITIKPPKGAEFGSTEVIYLAVQAGTHQRAMHLVDAVYGELEQHLQTLRRDKARTIFAELENTVQLAEGDLAAATLRLEAVEKNVGSDLSELRNLNDAATGGGKLRTTLGQIENDLRTVQSSYHANRRLQEHLKVAQQDPSQLVAMPNDLLQSQPALQRLKDGLIDAQILTAQRLGKMSRLHPSVMEALESEAEIRRHLHRELSVAIRGLAAELELNAARAATLDQKKAELEGKLEKLAALRARYDNLVTEVRRRSRILEQAQEDLADARATQAAAQAASLITRWAEAETGDRPVGPGVLLITASGLAGGLVIGLGLVFLTAPLEQLTGRRWTDHIWGRRQSDESPTTGRRTDVGTAGPSDEQSERRRAADLASSPVPQARPSRVAPSPAADRDDADPACDPSEKPLAPSPALAPLPQPPGRDEWQMPGGVVSLTVPRRRSNVSAEPAGLDLK